MRLKILVILLLTLSSCTTFASKEYKEAINKSKEVQEIEINQISDNLSKLKNANSKIKDSINSLKQLPEDKKDKRIAKQIEKLTQKKNNIEDKITSLEKEMKRYKERRKANNLEPYICKATVATSYRKDPKIININDTGDLVTLSYIRKSDDSKWLFKCELKSYQLESNQLEGEVQYVSKAPYNSTYSRFGQNVYRFNYEVSENDTKISINQIEKESSSMYYSESFNLSNLK